MAVYCISLLLSLGLDKTGHPRPHQKCCFGIGHAVFSVNQSRLHSLPTAENTGKSAQGGRCILLESVGHEHRSLARFQDFSAARRLFCLGRRYAHSDVFGKNRTVGRRKPFPEMHIGTMKYALVSRPERWSSIQTRKE